MAVFSNPRPKWAKTSLFAFDYSGYWHFIESNDDKSLRTADFAMNLDTGEIVKARTFTPGDVNHRDVESIWRTRAERESQKIKIYDAQSKHMKDMENERKASFEALEAARSQKIARETIAINLLDYRNNDIIKWSRKFRISEVECASNIAQDIINIMGKYGDGQMSLCAAIMTAFSNLDFNGPHLQEKP